MTHLRIALAGAALLIPATAQAQAQPPSATTAGEVHMCCLCGGQHMGMMTGPGRHSGPMEPATGPRGPMGPGTGPHGPMGPGAGPHGPMMGDLTHASEAQLRAALQAHNDCIARIQAELQRRPPAPR